MDQLKRNEEIARLSAEIRQLQVEQEDAQARQNWTKNISLQAKIAELMNQRDALFGNELLGQKHK